MKKFIVFIIIRSESIRHDQYWKLRNTTDVRKTSFDKTIRISKNPFTGNLQTNISNPVYGEIPPNIPIMNELMRSRLMSMNNALPYTF